MKVSYVIIDWLILNKMKPKASPSPDSLNQEAERKTSLPRQSKCKAGNFSEKRPTKRTIRDWSKKRAALTEPPWKPFA
jgi:hypothetical protein|tara:strand:- start:5342 stop:5575 length:234 start_codon:yes stop_codon:yes gene_type:complete